MDQALLNSPLFALTLSLAAFQLGNTLYRRLNEFPLLHPTVTGASLVALLLPRLDIDYQDYLQANDLLMFWLGPATVALAVPLYQQLHLIRKMAIPMLLTCAFGAIFAAGSAVVIAYSLGASEVTMLSLAPKSVTTPIAIDLANEIGGLATLAAGCVALTAVSAMCLAPIVFRLLNITDPQIWGFCLGITAHGMGTARAFEMNATAGAFSSLAMCLTGAFSAALIPVVVNLI
ncbi:MAG: LrgB family protein [Oceanicoccus sp.]|uniref:LrgB family protein n=1 Tax=Oceanicoccus sp. TaxID=2691044 RepID=UPI0026049EF3|nr:LrgB family protein [Oceanicoccus sp.]MDG1772408.1 LrgB family protein [Oceanicoccus sp.]